MRNVKYDWVRALDPAYIVRYLFILKDQSVLKSISRNKKKNALGFLFTEDQNVDIDIFLKHHQSMSKTAEPNMKRFYENASQQFHEDWNRFQRKKLYFELNDTGFSNPLASLFLAKGIDFPIGNLKNCVVAGWAGFDKSLLTKARLPPEGRGFRKSATEPEHLIFLF